MYLCFPVCLDKVIIKPSRSMPPSQEQQIVVPDELLKNLAVLREGYATFLRVYKSVFESSPVAQKVFVDTLPMLLGRSLGPDHSFQSYFNKVVDEELSLFNITHLVKLCDIFPARVK